MLVTTHYFPAHGGGIERVAGELARELSGAWGMSVTWLASDCDPVPSGANALRCIAAPAWNGIERSLGIPYPLWSPVSLLRLWREVGAASVVHIHDYLYAGNLAAAVIARLRRKPLLVTQHVGFVPFRGRALRWLLSILNRALGAAVLRRADQVVFVSNSVREYFTRFTRFQRPPLLLANGMDPKLFTPGPEEGRRHARAAFGIADDRPILLFVGRFVEKKGLPIVAALARQFADCQWLLAGNGPIDPRAWGLSNVKVFSGMPQAELVAFYRAADLLVLPSKGEGFPLVVQESMACGTPALVGLDSGSALPIPGELLFSEDSESADAVERWSRRIARLLADGESLRECRGKVAEYAHRHWSWRACAAAYAEVIRDIAGASRGAD